MLCGRGRAAAHAASSPIHTASSSRIGAPCAAKMTGMRVGTAARDGDGVAGDFMELPSVT